MQGEYHEGHYYDTEHNQKPCAYVQVPAMPLITCVTIVKLLGFSLP